MLRVGHREKTNSALSTDILITIRQIPIPIGIGKKIK